VKPSTVSNLLDVNRQFYQTFALQFSQTRQRIQPGVRQLVDRIPNHVRILDLGCGNGFLWQYLYNQGYRGPYVGIDSSADLLKIARADIPLQAKVKPQFLEIDLSNPSWKQELVNGCTSHKEFPSPPVFDFILAFAVLHHIPGQKLRQELLRNIKSLLSSDGKFIHSEWQFQNNPRIRGRIQPWEKIGLDESQLDEGDYLIDWRHGGIGLRYVHLLTEVELTRLAEELNFRILETYYSDGQNDNQGLYQVWMAE
jgi:tRNA (uracil-5-)-methyltransferase TRM9